MASIFIFIFIFGLHSSLALKTNYSSLSSSQIIVTNYTRLKTYIVHVEVPHPVETYSVQQKEELERLYYSFLPHRERRMVHCYHQVITGFAARLSPEEVKLMSKKKGFVSASPEKTLSLDTTRSPAFLGLQRDVGFWKDSNYGKGIIIGVLDSGITPNHPSFSGRGIPRPPPKWRGRCDLNATNACNNKIIGARNFVPGETPVDNYGHGTHCAGIAAGNSVSGANIFGQAKGTASGVAPRAHLASYKVCSRNTCEESAILAGMDAAISDGVDVLSVSLGSRSKFFYATNLAIGAFSAIQRGIFVSCSAGNRGPKFASLSNEAPWVLTVGASTIDRNIRATALLGNNAQLNGESVSQPKNISRALMPLIYPGGQTGNQSVAWCHRGSFNVSVKGKIVLCDQGDIDSTSQGENVKEAGGAAMIVVNHEINGNSIPTGGANVLPMTYVGYKDGTIIKDYINSSLNSKPRATIVFRGTIIGVKDSPEVTSFSSRGPSWSSPGILKPDIIGPGRNVLAAWPFSIDGTTTRATFNMISGTSMACPHLTGIAALLKHNHPTWSPAAIKSAIMTTASLQKGDGNRITDHNKKSAIFYSIGAGHVNPSKANDPGLVYDIQPDDYIPYLCGLGYTPDQIYLIVKRRVLCSKESTIPEAQLNYPSFAIKLTSSDSQTYTRTVTNVGNATSSYASKVLTSSKVSVSVVPDRLNFTKVNQKLEYKVTFKRSAKTGGVIVEGFLTWTSVEHVVQTPVSIMLQGNMKET